MHLRKVQTQRVLLITPVDAYFQGLQAHINAKGVLQPMPVMPAVVEEVVPADDENKISLNDKLKRVAHSTEHLMTHLPANPFCEFCQYGKHRRAPHRAKHEAPARADKFGDKLYADHVFASRAAPGYDGSTCVFITLDSATSIPAAYPASSKSAAEVEKALRHNFGRHIAAHCTVASDSALEISAACNAIGVIHLGTTPDDSETHGIQERHNQELLRMTRTTLLAAGFAPEFWPLAIQHAAVSRAICGAPSPFERKTTKAFEGMFVPFGAQVSWAPPPGAHSKFEAAGEPALFVGWNFSSGFVFSDYLLMPLRHYHDKTFKVIRTRDVRLPQTWNFPIRDLRKEAAVRNFANQAIADCPALGLFSCEDDDAEPQPAPPIARLPSTASSSHDPLPSIVPPAVAPLPPVDNAPLPKGPVGRPQTRMPKHFNGRYDEWSRLSKKQQQREIDTARQQEESAARVAAINQLVAVLLAPAPLLQPMPQDASQPSGGDYVDPPSEQLWFSPPEEEIHNPHIENLPIFALVTRNLTRRDKEWNDPRALNARNNERDKLITNNSWATSPQEYHEVKRTDPHAKFTRAFTLTGIKNSEDEELCTFKARTVAQGSVVTDSNQEPVLFGPEVAAHATNMCGLTSVVTHGVITGTSSSVSDAAQAFTQPRFDLANPNQRWYIELPNELLTESQIKLCSTMRRPVFQLLVPLYGIPPASSMWHDHLNKVMTTKCSPPWIPVESWPQTYVRTIPGEKHNQVATWYVDDGIISGPRQTEAWNEIKKHIKLSEPEPVARLLGVSFAINKASDGHIQIERDMSTFFQQAVDQYESTASALPLSKHTVATPFIEADPQLEDQPGVLGSQALSLLMKLLYGARMCGPHLMFAICRLACCITRWSAQNDRDLCRLFSYIKWNPFTLRSDLFPSELDSVEIHAFPDADFAGGRDSAKSVSGGICGLATNSGWIPLDWESKRQSATATSTTESETVALASLARKVIPLQSLWSAFLGRNIHAVYHEDNMSTITVVKTGFSIALRHMQKHQRVALSFVHEATSASSDATLRHCPTLLQKGDLLTKSLNRVSFERGLDLNGIVIKPKK